MREVASPLAGLIGIWRDARPRTLVKLPRSSSKNALKTLIFTENS